MSDGGTAGTSKRGPMRLGAFRFDPRTGELTPVKGDQEPTRLAPQPAALLHLLAQKNGDLLTREEAQGHLWPDVQVEVDQALGFCLRQVRSALGDTAADPRYIETLPRRGYRLLVPVEVVEPEEPIAVTSGAPPISRWRWLAGAALVLLAATGLWLGWDQGPGAGSRPGLDVGAGSAPAIRLGIMPFAPPPDSAFGTDTAVIAEELLLALGTDPRLGVVGPRSTAAYASPAGSLARLARDYRLDYVVHGRFLPGDDDPGLLAELIRSDDGVHIWVHRFTPTDDPQDIAAAIETAVRERVLAGR